MTIRDSDIVADNHTSPMLDLDILRGECMTVIASAAAIDAEHLQQWIRELERQDAIGCYIDPTEWIRTREYRKLSLRMLRALAAFKRDIEPEAKG